MSASRCFSPKNKNIPAESKPPIDLRSPEICMHTGIKDESKGYCYTTHSPISSRSLSKERFNHAGYLLQPEAVKHVSDRPVTLLGSDPRLPASWTASGRSIYSPTKILRIIGE